MKKDDNFMPIYVKAVQRQLPWTDGIQPESKRYAKLEISIGLHKNTLK